MPEKMGEPKKVLYILSYLSSLYLLLHNLCLQGNHDIIMSALLSFIITLLLSLHSWMSLYVAASTRSLRRGPRSWCMTTAIRSGCPVAPPRGCRRYTSITTRWTTPSVSSDASCRTMRCVYSAIFFFRILSHFYLGGGDVFYEMGSFNPVLRFLLWQLFFLRQVVPKVIQPPPLRSSSPSFPGTTINI